MLVIGRSRPRLMAFTRKGVETTAVCGRSERWLVRRGRVHMLKNVPVEWHDNDFL